MRAANPSSTVVGIFGAPPCFADPVGAVHGADKLARNSRSVAGWDCLAEATYTPVSRTIPASLLRICAAIDYFTLAPCTMFAAHASCFCVGGAAIDRARLLWAVHSAEVSCVSFIAAAIRRAHLYYLLLNLIKSKKRGGRDTKLLAQHYCNAGVKSYRARTCMQCMQPCSDTSEYFTMRCVAQPAHSPLLSTLAFFINFNGISLSLIMNARRKDFKSRMTAGRIERCLNVVGVCSA